jgi:tetratricopeptide (TPR) repeat protein
MGEFQSAGEHVSEVVDNYRKQFGDADPALAHALGVQALVQFKLNQREVAERQFRQALDIIEPVVRDNYDFDTLEIYAHATVMLAVILNDRHDYLDAEPLARRASDVYVAGLPGWATPFVESQLQVARSLSGQGKRGDAELVFASLLKMMRPEPPPPLVASVLAGYARHLRSVHRDADAELLEARAKQLFPHVEVFSPKSEIVPASAAKPSAPTRK